MSKIFFGLTDTSASYLYYVVYMSFGPYIKTEVKAPEGIKIRNTFLLFL